MFEKTLSDIVKGIRANKRDTALYISQCIAEIKTELGSQDLYVKANALNKLTFLQMMGYPIENNAAFACVEVMASPRFAHKRIGYLAASQGFHNPTKRTTAEFILLTTNLFQKELKGSFSHQQRMYEAGLAVNCISNIVNGDLARDLLPELLALSKPPTPPYLRKKTLLCLFKLFLQYPDALRIGFDAIQGALEETGIAPSGQVVSSCAIHVVCELSHVHDARNYLHLAPTLFDLLTGSATNNWMLIKVVKLMGRLVPQEPRLARKLLEPLGKIVTETQAKSLLYESVYTITLCLPYCTKADGSMPSIVPTVVQLCHQTLHELVQESDPNLKYLGLVGLGSLLQSQPKLLLSTPTPNTKPLILQALSDADGTIRARALELLKGMTTRKNLRELMTQLLRQHVPQASSGYRKVLIQNMIQLCSGSKYQYFDGTGDFEWYLDLLFELIPMVILTSSESTGAPASSSTRTLLLATDKEVATLLQHQLLDVALRVLPVRPYAVKKCIQVLLLENVPPPILPSVAWIIGEYVSTTENMDHAKVVQHLLKPNEVLEPSTVAILIQASMKVYAVSKRNEACLLVLQKYLPYYQQVEDVEVMERAFTAYGLLKTVGNSSATASVARDGDNLLLGRGISTTRSDPDTVAADLLLYLYRPEAMKPISAKVQRKKRQQYQIPGVDLDDPEIDSSVAAEFLGDQAGAYLRMEAVSFTQQRPMETISTVTAISSGPVMEGFGSSNAGPATISPAPHMTTDSSAISFQHTNLNPQPSQTQQQRNDPFYLDSRHEEMTGQQPSADQFGMIQLDDVVDDDDDGKKKKKRSKKKKGKQADLGMFSANPTTIANTTAVVYASDDDDGDDLLGKKTTTTKPAGFAKIDLTVEDEAIFNDILPTREHRSVGAAAAPTAKSGKKAKKKKSKASKSSVRAISNEQTSDAVGDLLGFSTSVAPAPVAEASTPAPAPVVNAVSTAFDDLLSLEAPAAPAPVMASATSAHDPFMAISTPTPASAAKATVPIASKEVSSLKKAKKLPWMKATLKLSSSEGMTDWSKVDVYYRVSGNTAVTMVSFRIDNNLDHVSLDGLSITWRTDGSSVDFGTLGPDQSGEATAGPFSYKGDSPNMELRGALGTSTGARVPIKLSLPVTLHLSPLEGLVQEDVMTTLGSSQWSLESAKLDINTVATRKVGSILKNFFRAAQVEPNDNVAVGTLAASTRNGEKVFVLYKVMDSSVKVDVKCRSDAMMKPLVADLKRLLL